MKKIYILGLIYLFSFSLCLAETPSGDVYYNQTLGFKIVKPPAWVFEAAIDKSPKSVGTPVSEKELMKKLAKYKSKTLVQIQKYQQLYGDINPTVTVSAIKFDDGMFISKDPVKILGPFISLLKKKIYQQS